MFKLRVDLEFLICFALCVCVSKHVGLGKENESVNIIFKVLFECIFLSSKQFVVISSTVCWCDGDAMSKN